MAKVMTRGGKPLLSNGKVAVTSSGTCCGDCGSGPPPSCGDCSLPDFYCAHAISCEVTFDSNDTSAQDFLELMDGSDQGFGIFYEPGFSNISIYNTPGSDQIDVPVTGSFFGVSHSVCAQIRSLDETHVIVQLTVDGVSGAMIMTIPAGLTTGFLYAGARFGGGIAHRTVSCVSALGNISLFEEDFNFPTDSFDSFTGSASIVAGELRVDSTAGVDAYGEKDFAPDYTLFCCLRDVTEISTITIVSSVLANVNCTTIGCGVAILGCQLNCSGDCTIVYNRIDHGETFTGGQFQFKLWFDTTGPGGACYLNVTFWDGSAEFSYGPSTCARECSASSCIQWAPGFDNFCADAPRTFTEGCQKVHEGLLELQIDNVAKTITPYAIMTLGVHCICFSAPCTSEDALCCGYGDVEPEVITSPISFTIDDVSGIIGTYSIILDDTTIPATCSAYHTHAEINLTIA